MTKPERPSVDKYREGLVCLVPRADSKYGITCHEKTLCDCQVLEIFAALDAALAERDEYAKKYSAIELANKEMSRNDHVTLGELLLELEQLKADYGTCDAERDTLKAEVERLQNSFDVTLMGQENNHLRALCGELVGALDKTLLAACWFHEGPSPELDDYKSAQQALAKARKELNPETKESK